MKYKSIYATTKQKYSLLLIQTSYKLLIISQEKLNRSFKKNSVTLCIVRYSSSNQELEKIN